MAKILIIDDDVSIGNMIETALLKVSAKVGIDDKVNMLLGGAADYLTKPFELKELLARIEVQLRKKESREETDLLTAGELTMRLVSREVTLENQPVHLTKTEYAILKILLKNPGQAIAKSVLLDRISEDTLDCTEASLKMHVSNLRKKLREVDGKEHIESVWGIGFRLL